jgi:hypothetical protein
MSTKVPLHTSSFGLPQFQSYTNNGPTAASNIEALAASNVYIDPEILRSQKQQSLTMLDNQMSIAKDRARAEFEAQKQATIMKAEHELSMATASMEQSKVQSLFALDQQFQQRRMEIEQRAQEQRLQIEATASSLLMTAEQQRLEKEMQEKMAKVYGNMHMHQQPSPFTGSFGQGSMPSTAFYFPQVSYVTQTQMPQPSPSGQQTGRNGTPSKH